MDALDILKESRKTKTDKGSEVFLIAFIMLSLEHKMLFTKVTVSDVTTFVADF